MSGNGCPAPGAWWPCRRRERRGRAHGRAAARQPSWHPRPRLKQSDLQHGLAGGQPPALFQPALPGTASSRQRQRTGTSRTDNTNASTVLPSSSDPLQGWGGPTAAPALAAPPCRRVAAPGELQGERLPEKMLEAAEQRNSRTPAAVGELDAVTPSQECVFLPAAVAPTSR